MKKEEENIHFSFLIYWQPNIKTFWWRVKKKNKKTSDCPYCHSCNSIWFYCLTITNFCSPGNPTETSYGICKKTASGLPRSFLRSENFKIDSYWANVLTEEKQTKETKQKKKKTKIKIMKSEKGRNYKIKWMKKKWRIKKEVSG